MVSKSVWLLVIAATLTTMSEGARILGIFPSPSRSHIISFTALTKELARRGHQVTVVSTFPQEVPLANYTDIVVRTKAFALGNEYDLFIIQKLGLISKLLIFRSVGYELCNDYLSNPDVQKLIHGTDQKFDLIIVEAFNTECLLGFVHKYNVPMVALSAPGSIIWQLNMMGSPNPYAYVPNQIQTKYTDHMSFVERMLNMLQTEGSSWFRVLVTLPAQDAIMRSYFNDSAMPYITDLEKRTSLLLLNSHVTMSYPKPHQPNVVDVGGMHIQDKADKLPKSLQTYLDEAKDGVIYFSLGTNAKSSNMPEDKRRAFVDTFSKVKQRVLWKWEDQYMPGKSANVRLGKWLPQASILAHPNVKVFVTHVGLLSLQETVYRGVPIVGMPIYMDEEWNMKKALQLGIGVFLDYDNITSDSLQWALGAVLNDPSYRENAQRASTLFKDQPTTPLAQAVFWTEYMLRHKGAPHLRSAALDLAWYEYWLLDVLVVLFIAAYLVLKVTCWLVKAGIRRIARTNDSGLDAREKKFN